MRLEAQPGGPLGRAPTMQASSRPVLHLAAAIHEYSIRPVTATTTLSRNDDHARRSAGVSGEFDKWILGRADCKLRFALGALRAQNAKLARTRRAICALLCASTCTLFTFALGCICLSSLIYYLSTQLCNSSLSLSTIVILRRQVRPTNTPPCPRLCCRPKSGAFEAIRRNSKSNKQSISCP